MKKLLFTFGVGTKHRGKCVIITCVYEMLARTYVYEKYGQDNVAGVYDYDKYSHLIEKYDYEVVEERSICVN